MSDWKEHLEGSKYSVLLEDLISLVEQHSDWISTDCLNLVSAHNVLSSSAKDVLSSGLADKIMAGRIGKRDHAGSRFIDQIDNICVHVASRLFHAKYVEYRPLSGAIANGIAIYSLTQAGQTILAWPSKYGGHFTFQREGYPYYTNLKMKDVPCTEDDNIGFMEINGLRKLIENSRPSLMILGSSTALFPFQIKSIAKLCKETATIIMYDGAHVMGLIAGNEFQDPLKEGAGVLTGSTQKTIPGPVGGLILTNERDLANRSQVTTDHLVTNYQNNRVASVTIALIELLAFGKSLAKNTLANAQSLARSVAKQSLHVVGRKYGYTKSHQFLIDASDIRGGARTGVKMLEEANILSTAVALPSDYPNNLQNPSGIRIGTNEITRFGMGAKEMKDIANMISRILIDNEKPTGIRKEVLALKKDFATMKYVVQSEDIA